MMSCETSRRPLGRWRNRATLGLVLAFLAGALLSWKGLDQQAVSWVVQSGIDPDSNRWVEAFTLLGKAWLQIWLLFVWVLVSGRRREVLAGILALGLVAVVVSPLKLVAARARPYTIVKAQEAGHAEHRHGASLSFPSGDTASAFAVAGAISPGLGGTVRVALFVAGSLVGALRVTSLAHYPSDVLTGAAIGLLAGWLAIRLIDKWKLADRRVPFEKWLVWGGIVGLPVGTGLSAGTDDFCLFLKTWGVLAACVLSAIGFRSRWRRVAREVLVPFLATNRHILVSLAFIGVIVDNVLDGERPHELLPLDEPLSPQAALGALLVVSGVLIRWWSTDHAGRPLKTSRQWDALSAFSTHVSPFLIVCGLLVQLNDWVNWLVVVPVFVMCHVAFSVCRERPAQLSVSWEGGEDPTGRPEAVLNPFDPVPARLGPFCCPAILAGNGRIWSSLALACLPLLLEVFVEDFICESLLHMH